jgi:hypothetical protein
LAWNAAENPEKTNPLQVGTANRESGKRVPAGLGWTLACFSIAQYSLFVS